MILLHTPYAETGTGFAYGMRCKVFRRVQSARKYAPAALGRWTGDWRRSGRRSLKNILPFGRRNDVFRRHYTRWARAFHMDIQGRLGFAYPRNPAFVAWGRANRGYIQGRWDLNAWDFNPDGLRVDSSGCWEWASDKPALHQWAEESFHRRKEDGA